MTLEELKQRPHPDSDNIAWLTWHMARSQDVIISGNMGEEQLWTKDKWYEKFGREENTKDTGRKNTAEQIAAFKLPDISALLDYHRAVRERLEQYIICPILNSYDLFVN